MRPSSSPRLPAACLVPEGRAMLDALVSGTTNPEILAELARGRLRSKIPALKEALEGRFSAHHGLMAGRILSHIDYLVDESIAELSTEIERVNAPFSEEVELLETIAGVDHRTAEVLIAEIGVDMSRFPTHAHLASWAGMCPGTTTSRRVSVARARPARAPNGCAAG